VFLGRFPRFGLCLHKTYANQEKIKGFFLLSWFDSSNFLGSGETFSNHCWGDSPGTFLPNDTAQFG
jgi:hypothetical protein